ncbi:MAG: WYL domain-containing protein [Candidatus Cybelea sp.]
MNATGYQFPDGGRKRRADAPSEHVARIGWMLITLLCDGVLEYARCIDLFGISPRQFQRDLRKIRDLGRPHGFAVSPSKGGRVFLSAAPRRAATLGSRSRDVTSALARLAAAFGGPIAREMQDAIGATVADPRAGFLQVREPLPATSDHVTRRFEELKAAAAGPARVEFDYTPAKGARARRRVEPYHIVARSGRYYLVAYDLARRDWRLFAVDAIGDAIVREGTFTRRTVPERFLSERAVGWITGPRGGDVTVALSALIAVAVGARTWQQGQRFTFTPDGGAQITLRFEDLSEAVRWALQFGTEATVVGPPEAVLLALETAARIAQAYALAVGERAEGRKTA